MVHTIADRKARAAIPRKDVSPFLIAPDAADGTAPRSFDEAAMQRLCNDGHHAGTWQALGLAAAGGVQYKLCARKMLMIDRHHNYIGYNYKTKMLMIDRP